MRMWGLSPHHSSIEETVSVLLNQGKNTAAYMKLVWTLHSLGGELKKNIHNPEDKQSKVTITESNLSASSANTNTHAHTCIINAFHFKVLPIFWWHSHSSRVKQHLAASISIIKYFKQHPASTSVTPSRPMQLSFLSESVSICICHPRTHLRVINRCVRMQNNWCSLGRDWMGLSGAFNQCIFSL